MKITVIGTGYVGLVSGTCFANMGFDVTCVDIDAEKIRNLNENGVIPIHEPGLAELVVRNKEVGRLHFTTDLATCVPQSDVVFIAVGTPQGEDGSADMQYVMNCAAEVAPHLQNYTVIVNKSTVPAGTAQRVTQVVQKEIDKKEKTADKKWEAGRFEVCSNPEFLREGNAIHDFNNPDRIVVGGKTEKALEVLRRLYQPLTEQGVTLLETDPTTSELIKYAANAFLAAKITFANEMAFLCERTGANIFELTKGMGLDSRIGDKFLQVSPGVGGSCFPKDTQALVRQSKEYQVPQTIIEATIKANEAVKLRMVEKVRNACGGNLLGKNIAVLGLAFKANTDDVRYSASLYIIPKLQAEGAIIVAYDPEAIEQAQQEMPDLQCSDNVWDASKDADAVIILTEWDEFRSLDLNKLRKVMSGNMLIDLRGVLQRHNVEDAGLMYTGLGANNSVKKPKGLFFKAS